ncbi:hypothetical protein [Mycobacteroides abscessus]|uniref:hypothetical protein n=1 Tax=Mycobacteroides abscessus TaxID=36809 RepID=UPI0009416962|nr:hypothetical protein [Mycobacteroides abscessus]QCO28980.1 hypothetical protein CFE69_23870 [Mycobacteroides abscessus subsp. massiliense]
MTAQLDLDDVVALARIIEHLSGSALAPQQSSELRAAYRHAASSPAGTTLPAIAAVLSAKAVK